MLSNLWAASLLVPTWAPWAQLLGGAVHALTLEAHRGRHRGGWFCESGLHGSYSQPGLQIRPCLKTTTGPQHKTRINSLVAGLEMLGKQVACLSEGIGPGSVC